MIKILYSSHSTKAKTFRTWVTDTLFTVQMGTTEQKEDLVSGIIGIPAKSLRQVLSTSSTNVPCIYRFSLGTCKDLRKIMKISNDIPDDHIIVKYGYTDNLVRRTAEHIKTYNAIKNVNLKLVNYAYVDPKYLSQAEKDIKDYLSIIEKPIIYEKFAELVAVNPKQEKQINTQFKYIAQQYSGCVKDLVNTIEVLKQEIIAEKLKTDNMNNMHLLELKNKNKDIENMEKYHRLELQNKNLEISQISTELQNKKLELENRDLKLQLLRKAKK